jgi:hypothetical protein
MGFDLCNTFEAKVKDKDNYYWNQKNYVAQQLKFIN